MTSLSYDADLQDLQAKWGRGWKIWRGRRAGDIGDERTGDWIASRMEDGAGVDPTVIKSTPGELNEALQQQLAYVAEGRKPTTIAEMGPE